MQVDAVKLNFIAPGDGSGSGGCSGCGGCECVSIKKGDQETTKYNSNRENGIFSQSPKWFAYLWH
jgi:hypothetical protein